MNAIVAAIAAYPVFVAEFLTVQAMDPYEGRGMLSLALIAFFGLGVVLAIILGMPTRGTDRTMITVDDAPDSSKRTDPRKIFAEDLLRLTIVIVGGSLLLHALMLAYNQVVEPVRMGNALDTENAALGYGAVYLPINALLGRIKRHVLAARREGEHTAKPARWVTIGIGLFQLGFPVYFLFALSQVYDASVQSLVRPVIVSGMGTVVAVTGVVAVVLLILRGNPPVHG